MSGTETTTVKVRLKIRHLELLGISPSGPELFNLVTGFFKEKEKQKILSNKKANRDRRVLSAKCCDYIIKKDTIFLQ